MRLSARVRSARGERGSVLALVPAGFLVLMILGALAVDNGATYLGQRQLQATLQDAANDAAGGALANSSFYAQGRIEIDPAQAAAIVCQDLAAQVGQEVPGTTVEMAVVGPAVFLEGHAEVRAVFGRIIPGLAFRAVNAEAAALAARSAAEAPPGPPPQSTYSAVTC
jgi:uncharacterized membrane protein